MNKLSLLQARAARLFTMAFLAMLGLVMAVPARADDISDLITDVSAYATSAIAVGVVVLLFVIGRKVVRKLI